MPEPNVGSRERVGGLPHDVVAAILDRTMTERDRYQAALERIANSGDAWDSDDGWADAGRLAEAVAREALGWDQ